MTVSAAENLIPVWEQATITLLEAVDYTGIARDRLKEISDREDCEFVFWVGNRRLYKRKKLEEPLEKTFSP